MMEIISEDYRKQNQELHETNEKYGTSGAGYRDPIRPLSEWGRLAILDFGCGKQTLAKSLGPAYRVTDYDPCIPGLDKPPDPHDIVACTDVLEHIEPGHLFNVLTELRRLTLKKCFVAVALKPSSKVLSDGRNSHLSLHSVEDWQKKLEAVGFKVAQSKPKERVVNMMWWCLE